MAIRARAIASGKRKPKPDEPKIWFISMRSLADVLSDDNHALLKLISEGKPESMSRLAKLSGRAPSNLSRTLKTMEGYGRVELRRQARHVQPVARPANSSSKPYEKERRRIPALDWIGKTQSCATMPKYRFAGCSMCPNWPVVNLTVEGDNLRALKALLPHYSGQVKGIIYIDPP